MTGRIFEIQHFALYDGPGIRTVVYFKGCPLHCRWCHNPEGQSDLPELQFFSDRCTSCGLCARLCPNGVHDFSDGHRIDRVACTACGRCARLCPSSALALAGTTVSVDDVMREILCDVPYYGEEGGVTLSGGESLRQPDFCAELLASCKAHGISACVETCGYAPRADLERIADAVDLFLFDVKEPDRARHRALTGVDNRPILDNLAFLNTKKKRIILRCPCIPGENLTPGFAERVADLAARLDCVEAVELEPYHPLGLSKYRSLDRSPACQNPDFLAPEALSAFAGILQNRSKKPVRLATGEPIPVGPSRNERSGV